MFSNRFPSKRRFWKISQSVFFIIILNSQYASAFWPWDKDNLAKVNGEIITIDTFKNKLGKSHTIKDIGEKMSAKIALVNYHKILDEMIDERLMIQDAVRIGLDNSNEYIEKYNLEKLNYSLEMLRKEEILNKINISEEEMYEQFLLSNETVRIRLLFIKNSTKAEKLLKSLKEGADFVALVKKESEDTEEIIKKEGDIGFNTRALLHKKMADIAFSLKEGEISDLIPLKNGFYIIRLEERKIPAMKIPEKPRERIRQNILAKKAAIQNDKYLASLKQKAKINVNEAAMNSISLKNKREIGEIVVATINGKPIKGKEIILRLRFAPRTKKKVSENKLKKTILDKLIRDKLLEMEVAKKNYEKDENLQRYIRFTMDSFILKLFKNKILNRAVKLDEDELKKYYKDHEREFKIPDKIRLRIIMLKKYEEAHLALEELKRGANFGIMAFEISKDQTAAKKGDTGWILSNRVAPEVEKKLEEMKIGEIDGPFRTNLGYMILRLEDREKGKIVEFEKARNSIVNFLARKKYDQLSEEYIKKLRSISIIKINESALKGYIESRKIIKEKTLRNLPGWQKRKH